MDPLIKALALYYSKYEYVRLRDKRPDEHYASDIMKDLLEQYWRRTGVPETNPTDVVGYVRMEFGNAIEKYMVYDILSKLHLFGMHLLGTQVPAGGSDPNFNMYFDAVMVEREGAKWGEKFVLEVKVKNDAGADFLMKDFNPGDDYLAQMSLYLEDAYTKKNISEGKWLFVLNSERTRGDYAVICARWLPKTREIEVYRACTLSGIVREDLSIRFSADIPKARAKQLEEAVKAKIAPKQEFLYKEKITPQLLREQSDTTLRAAMNGEKIIGHWKPKYSSYKDLIVKNEGSSMEYTEDEQAMIRAEYKRRHPKSKVA